MWAQTVRYTQHEIQVVIKKSVVSLIAITLEESKDLL